mgnify:CR=1 FL=1
MSYKYSFIHSEWNDICNLNDLTNSISRSSISDENGDYKKINNKIY